MHEIAHMDVNDVKLRIEENYRNMKPEREMSVRELNEAVRDVFEKSATETKEANGNPKVDTVEKNIEPSHKDCFTTSEERKKFAVHSKGDWDAEPGNSTFHPEKQAAKEALEKYKQDGVKYKDGEPNFSKVSEATVEIDDMTSYRYNNFRQADEKCAEQWNQAMRDGRTDWTARKVEKWREENRYSWHERLDMKTMDLVQRDVHEECKHYGGVVECSRHEALNGGGFDE